MYDGHMFGFGGGFMWIFPILLIVAIVLVVKAVSGSGKAPPVTRKSALDILEERYARGEIDQQEFEQKRQDLQQ